MPCLCSQIARFADPIRQKQLCFITADLRYPYLPEFPIGKITLNVPGFVHSPLSDSKGSPSPFPEARCLLKFNRTPPCALSFAINVKIDYHTHFPATPA